MSIDPATLGVDAGERASVRERTIEVDGLRTRFLEAGSGAPLVLLHGGEFGASAKFAWGRIIARFADRFRVIAPDVLGFGGSAKVVDFEDGRGIRIRHIARLCELLQLGRAAFVGNSMGAVMLLVDAASAAPVLPMSSLVAICGGGKILANEHMAALVEYDGRMEAMRRILAALFHDPSYPADDQYVRARWESSMLPGAWEAVAAARFRRPGHVSASTAEPDYARIGLPSLLIEGGSDKLKPPGWAAGLAARIVGARSAVIASAGHCPQIERPEAVADLVLSFLDETPCSEGARRP